MDRELVTETFCNILEMFAFIFADPVEVETVTDAPEDARAVRMTFSGDRTGTLEMAVPAELCGELAANVLGVEPDDPACIEKGADALQELLNVLCGQLLTAVAGEDVVCDLSQPKTELLPEGEWSRWIAAEDTLAFSLEEMPCLLRMQLT